MKVSKKIYGSTTPFEIRIEKSVGRTFLNLKKDPRACLLTWVYVRRVGSFIFKPIRSWLELTEYEKGYSFIQLYIKQAHIHVMRTFIYRTHDPLRRYLLYSQESKLRRKTSETGWKFSKSNTRARIYHLNIGITKPVTNHTNISEMNSRFLKDAQWREYLRKCLLLTANK